MTAAQRQWRQALKPPRKTVAQKQLAAAKSAADREKLERKLRLMLISSPLTRNVFTTQYKITWLVPQLDGTCEEQSGYFDAAIWYSDVATRHEVKLAIEVEGGIWMKGGGRHNRPEGYTKDTMKYNQATLQRWPLLRFTSDTLEGALPIIEQFIRDQLS